MKTIESKIEPTVDKLTFTGLLAAGLLFGLSLHAPPAAASSSDASTQADGSGSQGGDQPEDGDLLRAIESALLVDPAVPFHAIDVAVHQGIVTLSGSVDNLLAADRATEVVRSVRGVRSVVSTVRVDPPEVSDQQLASDVENALLLDPVADSYEIRVGASDGVVTLEGTVQSWAESEFAAQVARGVPGVRRVDDRLTIEWGVQRPDAEIATEIRERLRWDVQVADGLIDTSVDDGRVTLTGSVGSASEREQARRMAWVAGVSSVDASALDVRPWLKSDMIAYGKHENLDDGEIATAIRQAFLYDPRVLSSRPEVDVEDGVVTLTGVVTDRQARQAAEQDALATVGVWRVRNLLKVRPETSRSDEAIESDIHQHLVWDPYLDSGRIAASVSGQVAYLSGEVSSFFERNRAEEVASRVRGVVDVRNLLRVETVYVEARPDAEIREEIESELLWSPFVDADQVSVQVEDGRAILTGEVDSFAERRAATENAFEGGAVEVENRLAVAHRPDWLF